MGLRHHTIIFVPHTRARFRKWRVSNRQLALGTGLAVLFLAGAIFTTWSFFANTIDHQALDQVAQENEELRQVNQSFEDSIRRLEKQLAEFEERTRQLAIVAGLESLANGQETGIGGSDDETPVAEQTVRLAGLLERRAVLLATDMATIEGLLDERIQLISSTPAISPVKGILTSGFGYRRDPISGRRAMHRGIDLSTSPGQPVRAAADGIVVRAGRLGGLGKAVHLSHGYGINTRYGHLSKIDVSPGTRVRRFSNLREPVPSILYSR